MPIPPTGTVTFLFTDIEGSTRLAQQFPATWPSAKARHHAIVQSAIKPHGGYVFQVIGDAFCAAPNWADRYTEYLSPPAYRRIQSSLRLCPASHTQV